MAVVQNIALIHETRVHRTQDTRPTSARTGPCMSRALAYCFMAHSLSLEVPFEYRPVQAGLTVLSCHARILMFMPWRKRDVWQPCLNIIASYSGLDDCHVTNLETENTHLLLRLMVPPTFVLILESFGPPGILLTYKNLLFHRVMSVIDRIATVPPNRITELLHRSTSVIQRCCAIYSKSS